MIRNTSGSERHLIETLDRISRNSAKYSAVYINVSKLQLKNRHPKFIKILARLFDGLVGATMGAFFVLSNGDFVIIGSDISAEKISTTIENLKKSMRKDPIIHTHEPSAFVKTYVFPENLSDLYMQVSSVIKQKNDMKETESLLDIMENYQVDTILHIISSLDFTKIIKHQSAIKILSSSKFEVINQEFFVASKDLNKEIDMNVDIASNKWMYTYISEQIDKKLLNTMVFSSIKNMPKEISINLNMSTVYTDDFNHFVESLHDKTSLIVELSLMDVFNNIGMYFKAKEMLHSKGIKVLIDSITPDLLEMINLSELKPDLIKIFWHPLMEYSSNSEKISALVNELGEKNVILAKCLDAKALKWGVVNKISVFQGPYIDELETAIIKTKCPHKDNCSTEECLKRKRLIGGAYRDECQRVDVLETLLDGS